MPVPPHPFHAWGPKFFGPGGSGWLAGLFPFAAGALAATFVISLFKHGEPRISRTLRKGVTPEGMTIEELIAEKERLEDLIAERAVKEGKG